MPSEPKSIKHLVVYITRPEIVDGIEWRALVYHKTVKKPAHGNTQPQYTTRNFLDFEWRAEGRRFWRPSTSWPLFDPSIENKGLPPALFCECFENQREEALSAYASHSLRYKPPRKVGLQTQCRPFNEQMME